MLYKKILASALFFFAATFAGALIAAFISPPIINVIEERAGRALSYEVWLRLYLGIILLCAYFGFAFGVSRDWWSKKPFAFFTAWLVVILAVLTLDQRWVITEENSWIRYPTAFALTCAGLILARFAYIRKLHERRAAAVLSAGLVFAAADEILTIHERIGVFVERVFMVSHTATDVITVIYGVIGFAVLAMLGLWLREWVRESSSARTFVLLYAVGMLLFIAATAFDTIDGITFSLIRRATDALATRGYEFSDIWFIIWKPKLFLNAAEEVYECAAAGLFLLGAWWLYQDVKYEKNTQNNVDQTHPDKIHNNSSENVATRFFLKRKTINVLACLFVVSIFWLGYISIKLPNKSPLMDSTIPVTRIASLAQGLFHADDLDFHPRWGVVLANESDGRQEGKATRAGVFTYKNGVFERLPDPRNALLDIDSVAATTNSIYASNGVNGKVLAYNAEKNDWEEYKKFVDGIRPLHPEAIAVQTQAVATKTDSIAVIDESERAIYVATARGVTRETPNHPLFKTPEGIVWHSGLKQFIITDDTTGAVFTYTPGKPLTIFADTADGLRYPEDVAAVPSGDVIISDNGRREIIIFDSAGTVKRRLRLRGLYRDVQGVTVDSDGNLYFVTADAFESESFIPSFLWRVELQKLKW